MPRYAVLQNYGSSAYGPWEQGSQVELEPDQAAWVNRDSPGTLARVRAGVQLEIGRPVPADKLLKDDQPEPEPQPEPQATPEPEPPAATKTHEPDPAQQPGPTRPPSPPPAQRSAPAPQETKAQPTDRPASRRTKPAR